MALFESTMKLHELVDCNLLKVHSLWILIQRVLCSNPEQINMQFYLLTD
jgi:hypothetical protein